MATKRFPKRLVHQDFHTSPDIPDIGSRFTKEKFQNALKVGNVSSITVFAKCHHGYCYYPTEVGSMHPGLGFDLLGEMIDAAHEIGVNAPVYITAGWSHKDATEHPEWVSKNKDGSEQCVNFDKDALPEDKKPYCSWQTLCLNDNSYCQHIYELTEEICKRYKKLDGLFYDICINGNECYCDECRAGMKREGFDVENIDDVREYFVIKRKAFMEKCGNIMRQYHPDATIFFNSGGADQYRTRYHEMQTHFEMEDLPTAWGGYDKMPPRAKYFSRYGKDYFGMTGKFHLDWGEFGGFKSKEALKYEAASMALYGAGCSVGDHLHPDGEPEMQTYENIGYAFRYLESIEPYCYGGKPVVNVGLMLSQIPEATEGISNILLETQIDYSIINNGNFKEFNTVIIPEGCKFGEEDREKLREYVSCGGKVLAMGDGIVEKCEFIIDTGLEYIGKPVNDIDYIYTPNLSGFEAEIPNAPMLCNNPAERVRNIDAEIISEVLPPYFNRTYAHFCGHKNTPYNKSAERAPAISKKGNVVYMAHPIASVYREMGSLFFKRYLIMALDLIYNERVIKTDIGSCGRCTVINQEDKSRYCLNMTYAAPVRRGVAEIIEDIMPLYNIPVLFNTDKKIERIYIALTGEELEFCVNGDGISFVIPKLECHTSVVMEYKG